ncbi:cytochrome P450 [Aspergillus tanneri]|uniref:Cytochrome P450 monooxygenase n=1 Tax=Aspergillus tanneri TaxID=1220188 RepID=A0A5M9MMC2_9EURO|nr:uncharacterized protein ATNIH1004_004048 [Aspergillus tanneri]KAA8648165.1 hypothetical protein ATNIH1004_004048 [Aspergillus tanneri]
MQSDITLKLKLLYHSPSNDLSVYITILTVGALFAAVYFSPAYHKHSLPLVNSRKALEFTWTNTKKRFYKNAGHLCQIGFKKSSNAFRLVTDGGIQLILAPKYLTEIRTNPSLRFEPVVKNKFHSHIPGFEAFGYSSLTGPIFKDTIRKKMVRALGNIVDPMIQDANSVITNVLTDNPEWHQVCLADQILRIVGRLSSRVFVGEELSRCPEWLDNIINYIVGAADAADSLRLWPRVLRPIAAHFSPDVRRLRTRLQKTRDWINPLLERKRMRARTSIEPGEVPKASLGITDWFEERANGCEYDVASAQLNLAFVSISSISDMITQLIYDLCGREELVQNLRHEIVSVLSENGWGKATLYKLRLLDSVMKESQRLKPVVTGLQRYAEKEIVLSDGIIIPRGTFTIVSGHHMYDPEIYPNARSFDGYRFYNIREFGNQVGNQELWTQFASASDRHIGFGYGQHACPGRFFARNQIKIIMCHLLLHYDFRPVDGSHREPRPRGFGLQANPSAKIAIRRRCGEIVL